MVKISYTKVDSTSSKRKGQWYPRMYVKSPNWDNPLKPTYKDILFEVDEFEGTHNGLVLVEVELKSTKDIFEIPKWVDKEVTGDKKYYNSYLSNSK